MKRIISGILAVSMISSMSGVQGIYAESMEESSIEISNVSAPSGRLEKGQAFGLRGIISSKYNIKLVEAKIYIRNSDTVVQEASINPDSKTFDIHPDIDYGLPFGSLDNGLYTYILYAEDINGYGTNLIESDFQVGYIENVAGDATLDGIVDISDVVAVASYVGNPIDNPIEFQGLINADVHNNGDGVTSSDVLMIQQYLAKIITTIDIEKPIVTTQITETTTPQTSVTTVTEVSVSTTTPPEIPKGIPDFISDAYYKCCDTNVSSEELDVMVNSIISGEYSVEELMLNLINYKFSNGRDENSNYIHCIYNSILKREPSQDEMNTRVSQLETGKSRFSVFLEVSKSSEFKNICQKYNISSYRHSLENIYGTVILNDTHSIYRDSELSETYGTAYDGQILNVSGFKGDCLEVKFLDGTGYIKSKYVSPYGNSATKVLDISNIPQNSYIGGAPLPTGCEVTSLSVLMNYLGFSDAGKNYLANTFMPKGSIGSTDPNYAFIGSPDSNSSYGAYANAIVRTANNYFSAYEINNYSVNNITGAELSQLYSQIDKGNPVLVWITMGCTSSRAYGATWTFERGTYYTEPGTGTYSFTWKKHEHCCVLAGYNKAKGTVILADVLEGDALTEYTIPEFESAYRWLGNQAVIIEKTE